MFPVSVLRIYKNTGRVFFMESDFRKVRGKFSAFYNPVENCTMCICICQKVALEILINFHWRSRLSVCGFGLLTKFLKGVLENSRKFRDELCNDFLMNCRPKIYSLKPFLFLKFRKISKIMSAAEFLYRGGWQQALSLIVALNFKQVFGKLPVSFATILKKILQHECFAGKFSKNFKAAIFLKPEWVSEHQWAPLNGRNRNIEASLTQINT